MDKRILIVEDEAPIANMIAMNLRVSGMESVIYGDGDEVLCALPGDHAYDLALLDIMVPGRDGFALLEALKPYDIPVIFLSARDDIATKVGGLQGGAEDYITKPFEILELLVRIEKVLSRRQKNETVVCFSDIEMNFESRVVKKAGQEVVLKPMEFDLLAVLVKHKNVAVSREELLRLAWGSNYLGETRTVDVHIGQLRKKLSLHEAVKTIPKVGYRLEIAP